MSFRTGILFFAALVTAHAQWLNYPVPGTPLTKAGNPNLNAKAPRAANGKPDLSGVWQIEPPPPGEFEQNFGPPGAGQVFGDDVRDQSKYFFNLFADFKPGEERPKLAPRRRKISRASFKPVRPRTACPTACRTATSMPGPSKSSRRRKCWLSTTK
jgi:hypothetical protein